MGVACVVEVVRLRFGGGIPLLDAISRAREGEESRAFPLARATFKDEVSGFEDASVGLMTGEFEVGASLLDVMTVGFGPSLC